MENVEHAEIKQIQAKFGLGCRYGVCIAKPGPIIFEHNDLKEIYFWCGCISGSMQSSLLIIDMHEGRVVDEFKLNDRREV